MSSCSSRAMRVRSASCASISLRLKVGHDLFSLLSFGDVDDYRKNALFTVEFDQFGGTEAGPNLTVSARNLVSKSLTLPIGEQGGS